MAKRLDGLLKLKTLEVIIDAISVAKSALMNINSYLLVITYEIPIIDYGCGDHLFCLPNIHLRHD